MKKALIIVTAAVMMAAACAREEISPVVREENAGKPVAVKADTGFYVQGRTIVKLSEELTGMVEQDLSAGRIETRSQGMNNVFADLGVVKARRLFPDAGEFEPRTRREGLHRWYVLEFSEDVPVTKAGTALEGIEGVELVEPVSRIGINDFNDVGSASWDLKNTSYPGFDINVIPVWNYYTAGNSNVIVAVVDGGIDLSHEDLAANCLTTGNYNFVDDNTKITPDDHGTHVAGTIGAVGNNGIGIAGIAGGNYLAGQAGVKLMSCQVFRDETVDGKEVSRSGDMASAIKWGADHGAVISQNSWGYNFDANNDGKLTGEELERALAAEASSSIKDAVTYFVKYAGCDNDGNQLPDSPMKGGVVFFSAGNDGITNGAPANYEKVIAVGSINSDGTRASYSNYGDWVDIAAPGTSIYSTLPSGKYGSMSGTSMACPHASGVAALLVSYYGGQGFTCEMLKEKLLGGSNKTILPSAYNIGGLLDAYGAFTHGSTSAPARVSDAAASVVSNTLGLEWTNTADDEGIPAYGALILYGTDRASVESATASSHPGVSALAAVADAGAGEKVSVSIKGLDFETDYYVKMIAYSYSMVYAEASQVQSFRTGRNNAPEIVLDANDLKIKTFENVKVTASVSEPDGHNYTFTYVPGSDADTFTPAGAGTYNISIVGKRAAPGSYSAVLEAKDEYGLKTTCKLEYTILENSAPVAVAEIEDIVLVSSGQEFTIDMKDYVTDPDGETLKYEVTMSNDKVVHFNAREGVLYGAALNYGVTDVEIKATDAAGAYCVLSFKVAVIDGEESVRVYPNPVVDVMNVATGVKASAKVTVLSAAGNKVFEAEAEVSYTEPMTVDMKSCAPGRYTVKIATGGKEYVRNVVKL